MAARPVVPPAVRPVGVAPKKGQKRRLSAERANISQDKATTAKPRVLLIAPPNSYRIGAYLRAAQRMDLDILIASEGRYSIVGAIAQGLHVNLDSPEALPRLAAEGRERGFAGVVATDDGTVELAGKVAGALGLPHNSVESMRMARRKDLARQSLALADLPVPGFQLLDLTRLEDPQIRAIRYPCVAKPLALSASRGVIRADKPRELYAACRRIRAILREVKDPEERERVLVEDFIPGPEVAVEGMLHDGELRILALFDKPDPLDGPFFEETYYVTPSRLAGDIQEMIARRVQQACEAHGLRQGPIHAELRLYKGDAWILEVAARTIGGQCARLLRFGTGSGLEELVLAQAVGRRPRLEPGREAAGVLMIPIPQAGILRRVEGVLAALKAPYVEDVEIYLREGYQLVPLPEGGSYLGFIFSRAPTPEKAEEALRSAHACLKVVTAPLLPVLSPAIS